MILPCTCDHKDQDQLHGKGRRVHNMLASSKQGGVREARCTICLKIKIVKGSS